MHFFSKIILLKKYRKKEILEKYNFDLPLMS